MGRHLERRNPGKGEVSKHVVFSSCNKKAEQGAQAVRFTRADIQVLCGCLRISSASLGKQRSAGSAAWEQFNSY
jgi:hypothetical protein